MMVTIIDVIKTATDETDLMDLASGPLAGVIAADVRMQMSTLCCKPACPR